MLYNRNGFQMSTKKGCDECEDQPQFDMGGSLKEKVWNAYLQEKKIILNCDIDESLIEKAIMQVFSYNEYDRGMEAGQVGYEADPIRIYINSAGGSLDEAFSLVSAIEASKTPVVTIALGKAYSAAFLILLAGHARYAQARTTLMYHQGSAGIAGEFNRMIEYVKHWENCQNEVEDYVIKKTKIKKKQLQQIFNGKQDFYMNAQTAIELGCIDGIWKY
jgi:ATP-dependent Clp protease protease subunit